MDKWTDMQIGNKETCATKERYLRLKGRKISKVRIGNISFGDF